MPAELQDLLGRSRQERTYALHSRIRAVAVGITIFLVVLEALVALQLPDRPYSGIILNNLTVARVSEGSPGQAAGFRKGDLITSVGGAPCSSPPDVSECLAHADPGDAIAYTVRRGDQVVTLPLTFSRPPFSEILR